MLPTLRARPPGRTPTHAQPDPSLEVAPAGPLRRDVVVDHGRGVIQQAGLGSPLPDADGQLGLLAAEWAVPSRPRPSVKPPTSSNTSRRNDMLAPMRVRTCSGRRGSPV